MTSRRIMENKSELQYQIGGLQDLLNNSNEEVAKRNFVYAKFQNNSFNENFLIQCVQSDLLDYQNYVKEIISYKRPVIDDLIKKIQETVDEVNPNFKVHLYGSYATGLCLPWSDMDVVLINTNKTETFDEYLLGKLYMKLVSKPWIKSYKLIDTTNVPIIKLISNDTFEFHIDISVENERHFGLKCVQLVKTFLKEYHILEPIVLALKTLLYNGNLNDPYKGGLSSYGLILMVVSFIQSEIENIKFKYNNPMILGETFLSILRHYGIIFDFGKYAIFTYIPNDDRSESNIYENILSLTGQNSHEVVIVDPLNNQNNVAKSSFQFTNIKMAFMVAYVVAREDCECGCHYDYLKNKTINTEHCILKRIFNSVKRFSNNTPNHS
ncbi:MAG: nucleotidyltransferase domain-containing protein [archaeon]|nr:nucleotidyltransferase domain-containing protein [archaeon]